jgi:hypothetical protein
LENIWRSGIYPSSKNKYSNLIRTSLLILIGFFTVPWLVQELYFGLDPAWIYFINSNNYFSSQNRLVFGRDVFFTYGPLGFLIYPTYYHPALVVAFIFQFVVWLCLLILLVYTVVRKKPYTLSLLTFCLVVFLVRPSNETPILLVILLSLSLAIMNETGWVFFAVLPIILSSILFYVKFNLGIFGITLSLITFLVIFYQKKRKSIRWLSILGLFCLILPSVIYLIYNPSIKDFLRYFEYDLELSQGYSAAMSYSGQFAMEWIAPVFTLIYLILLKILFDNREKSAFIGICIIPGLFLMFKGGFVRPDCLHSSEYYQFLLFSFAIIGLFIRKKSFIRLYTVILIAILGVGIVTTTITCNWPNPITNNVKDAYGRILNFPKFLLNSQDQDFSKLQEGMIDQSMIEIIGKQDVAILSNNLLYAPANHLTFSSFPVIQSYAAYTARLDQLNAAFLEQAQRNRFILFEFKDIDGRNPVLDTPATWQSVLSWYHVKYESKGLLLLERNTIPLKTHTNTISDQSYNIADKIPVPEGDQLIFAKIYLEYTFLGRITNLIYKTPPIYLEAISKDNSQHRFRVIPSTLVAGVSVSFIPLNLEDTRCMLENCFQNNIVSFHLAGPGINYFKNNVQIEFFNLVSDKAK